MIREEKKTARVEQGISFHLNVIHCVLVTFWQQTFLLFHLKETLK